MQKLNSILKPHCDRQLTKTTKNKKLNENIFNEILWNQYLSLRKMKSEKLQHLKQRASVLMKNPRVLHYWNCVETYYDLMEDDFIAVGWNVIFSWNFRDFPVGSKINYFFICDTWILKKWLKISNFLENLKHPREKFKFSWLYTTIMMMMIIIII
jgi:hypothetical protein